MKAFLKSALAVIMIFVIAITMFGPELDFSRPSKDNNSTGNNITINGSNGGVIGGIIVDNNGNIIYYPTTNGGFTEDIMRPSYEEDAYISEMRDYASSYWRSFNILFSGRSADSDVIFGELRDHSIMDSSYENFYDAANDLNLNLGMTTVAKELFAQEVRKVIDSGSNEYDIVVPNAKDAVALAVNGYLYNLNDTYPLFCYNDKGVATWWDEELINECTLGDNSLYFVTGPISAGYVCDLSAIVFNRDLFMELGFDPDRLENLVDRGMWSIDTVYQNSNSLYSDYNGNGQKDSDDLIGFVVDKNDLETLRAGANISYVEKDANGDFVLGNIGDGKGIQFCEFLYNTFYCQGAAVFSDGGSNNSNIVVNGSAELSMKEWRSVFTVGTVGSVIKDELYGFSLLPLPQYDENQGGYITPYSASGAVYAIPTSVSDVTMSAAYLEILAIRSGDNHSEVLEYLVKDYLYNGNSSKMLSYVMENPVLEYAPYLVSKEAPEFTTIVYDAVVNENMSVASTIKKSLSIVQRYLTIINDRY